MDTLVEHASSSRPPRPGLRRSGSSSQRGSRRRRLVPSSPAEHAAHAEPPVPAAAARGAAAEALVAAAAAGIAACVRAGWPGTAVAAARLLLSLGLGPFLTDITVQLVARGQATVAGALCIAAAQQGARSMVDRLGLGLLRGGHTAAAAATAGAQVSSRAAALPMPLAQRGVMSAAKAGVPCYYQADHRPYVRPCCTCARLQRPVGVWLLPLAGSRCRQQPCWRLPWCLLLMPGM